ncbi:hypothetical protein PVAR5_7996 [Paecilomyces variotii No. 5]|uniref:Uncharacterized protein n=1 Tax=Byssochlamys spectabilis (strain No. 5 / NBRC 109023) TaxID=1356009 RepID=V5I5F5_BYSSN|nr:hypothetical protein PVAR5_7996 [Paecilomyces variotii No. 5]
MEVRPSKQTDSPASLRAGPLLSRSPRAPARAHRRRTSSLMSASAALATLDHKRPAQQISHGPPKARWNEPQSHHGSPSGAPARPVESVVEAPVRTAAAAAETPNAGLYLTETA